MVESIGVTTFHDFKKLPILLHMIIWEMEWKEEHPRWENKERLVKLIQQPIKTTVKDWGLFFLHIKFFNLCSRIYF